MGGDQAALVQEPTCARRVEDRRVIFGILHVLKVDCRWCDYRADDGPSSTVHKPFNR
jgi:transposase